MANTPRLVPDNNFPKDVMKASVQVPNDPSNAPLNGGYLTIQIASSADGITPWGVSVSKRDQELRKFWPTESFLAGTLLNVCLRNSTYDWRIQGSSPAVETAVTDMLTAALSGDTFGWLPFVQKFSQDLYSQDNGAFIELIRDQPIDANSRFKGPLAPVIGIANIDSGQCQRTGNPEIPVVYTDREGNKHWLKWYEVIPFSDFPSPIQSMNGVGVCSISRALRLAQIIRSVAMYKDEEVSGRNIRKINIVGGVSNSQIDDAIKRTNEAADNKNFSRFIEHVILASLDPDKPVSVETVELASLPEGYDYDQEMQWYVAGLALDFGIDYQELAPLPGGNIGSASQSIMLHKKSSGKGPRSWMDSLSAAFMNYGVLPRGSKLIFNDKNEQEEMEKQEIRTKASEEAAIIVNAKIFPPQVVAQSLIRRGIYDQEDFDNTPPEWWKNAEEALANEAKGQPVGNRGGNTVAEDAKRTGANGAPNPKTGGRLRKAISEWLPFQSK